jgi:hypothetical protein
MTLGVCMRMKTLVSQLAAAHQHDVCFHLPAGASVAAAQLSAQLSEAQEQMVCAAVNQQPSVQRGQVARALEVRHV